MARELTTISGVGLRHVVEDGLSLLRGQQLPGERGEYVLERLSRLIHEAVVGSKIVEQEALFVGSKDRDAYESFSLFERHLRHHEGWRELLKGTERALDELKATGRPSEEVRPVAVEMLQEMQESLRRQGAGGIRSLPEEIELRRW